MTLHDTEQVIEDFLGDHPRAQQWRALRVSLAERLAGLRRTRALERQQDPASARLAGLDAQIASLENQVAALETEEAVAEFVENSLRVTLARSADGGEEDCE